MRTETYGATYPSLRDRAVLVSGGGGGIGAEITRHFARQGARVGFLDIAEGPSRALEAELREAGGEVTFVPADVTDIEALKAGIARVREAVGPIEILINNAAWDERSRTSEVTEELWDRHQAVNLRHQFFAAQAVIPDMKAAGGGAIVNLGSCSYLIGSTDLLPYMAAKAGVVALTRGLARELGPIGVRVNCVQPGWIMTERQLEKWVREEDKPVILEKQCVKRPLEPADIARAVLFFASDEAGGCSNQCYIVDGGWV